MDRLLLELNLELVPLSGEQGRLARSVLRYGKGQGHQAQLNYGDVMTHALAKDRGEVLAFVGNNFNPTDIFVVAFPVN